MAEAWNKTNEVLIGTTLTVVAGYIDAGAFALFFRPTSHMSGTTSIIANHLTNGDWRSVLVGAATVLPFVTGAAFSAAVMDAGTSRSFRSPCVISLLVQALLLLGCGLFGETVKPAGATIAILSFAMGMQNATSSTLTLTRMRTTHVTGVLTDLGIEVANLIIDRRPPGCDQAGSVTKNRATLVRVSSLFCGFVAGGISGTLGFRYLGLLACFPLGLLLLLLAGWMFYVAKSES